MRHRSLKLASTPTSHEDILFPPPPPLTISCCFCLECELVCLFSLSFFFFFLFRPPRRRPVSELGSHVPSLGLHPLLETGIFSRSDHRPCVMAKRVGIRCDTGEGILEPLVAGLELASALRGCNPRTTLTPSSARASHTSSHAGLAANLSPASATTTRRRTAAAGPSSHASSEVPQVDLPIQPTPVRTTLQTSTSLSTTSASSSEAQFQSQPSLPNLDSSAQRSISPQAGGVIAAVLLSVLLLATLLTLSCCRRRRRQAKAEGGEEPYPSESPPLFRLMRALLRRWRLGNEETAERSPAFDRVWGEKPKMQVAYGQGMPVDPEGPLLTPPKPSLAYAPLRANRSSSLYSRSLMNEFDESYMEPWPSLPPRPQPSGSTTSPFVSASVINTQHPRQPFGSRVLAMELEARRDSVRSVKSVSSTPSLSRSSLVSSGSTVSSIGSGSGYTSPVTEPQTLDLDLGMVRDLDAGVKLPLDVEQDLGFRLSLSEKDDQVVPMLVLADSSLVLTSGEKSRAVELAGSFEIGLEPWELAAIDQRRKIARGVARGRA
ncbi:hypothetical protein QTJ16_006517 [Diplocarpon rosae]|uniref:Uncharacterized protein n=1 Tax=Diplocarpon rosae TaxID=946125 RepID=A0AAD9WB64_9HELO|nr:hypothetical protein QTJ16_006517 [Diplocarpon rosae]